MKEVIVHPLPSLTTEFHDIPIPMPADDELIIKVVVAGSHVKGASWTIIAFSFVSHVVLLFQIGLISLHKKCL
jgi:hypothetical protein